MLETKITTGFDYLQQESAPVGLGRTIFDVPLINKESDANPQGPMEYTRPGGFMEDTEPIEYGTDEVYKYFSREIDVPKVLGVPETDKTSAGVYEALAPRANPTSIGNLFSSLQSNAPPTDATLFTNPAVEGLHTIPLGGTPLGNSYAGNAAYLSGNDPMPGMSLVNDQPEQETGTATLTGQSDCSWYDVPCIFQSLKGEVTIIIVGLAILIIGIFALTR